MAEPLYRLQEWMTVPDAAVHSSIAFSQEGTLAQIISPSPSPHAMLLTALRQRATGGSNGT